MPSPVDPSVVAVLATDTQSPASVPKDPTPSAAAAAAVSAPEFKAESSKLDPDPSAPAKATTADFKAEPLFPRTARHRRQRERKGVIITDIVVDDYRALLSMRGGRDYELSHDLFLAHVVQQYKQRRPAATLSDVIPLMQQSPASAFLLNRPFNVDRTTVAFHAASVEQAVDRLALHRARVARMATLRSSAAAAVDC
jgi:hypothetical protein